MAEDPSMSIPFTEADARQVLKDFMDERAAKTTAHLIQSFFPLESFQIGSLLICFRRSRCFVPAWWN
jgi:hypothetical protein